MAEVGNLSNNYEDLIDLSLGDPDHITDDSIIERALEDAKLGHTKYTNPLGYPELRQGIIDHYKESYNHSIDLSEVMVVSGAVHGMYLVLQSILDEGDEVIIPEPYYTTYAQQVVAARGNVVSLKTDEEESFQVNIDRLRSLINNRTKAIIINTPNNPTGACLSKEILVAIAQIASENDLIIIADDVYPSFSYGEPFVPIMTLEGMKERTITIGTFSKEYAMTGWRVGYVIGPTFIVDCIKSINEGICYNTSSISQRAALHALRIRELIQPQMVEDFRKRLEYGYERVNKIPNMSMLPPQGALYLFVNIKGTGLTSIEVSKKILQEAHVLVVPGIAFGQQGEGYIRVSCTVPMDKLTEAFDRIERMEIFKRL